MVISGCRVFCDDYLQHHEYQLSDNLDDTQVGGFLPWDVDCAKNVATEGLDLPVLTITGEADQLVPPSRSLQLSEALNSASPEYYSHGGAHMMPTCSGPCKQQIADFLDKASNPAVPGGVRSSEG
jgi:fermentation-respiration switch protein FrsA (DUF1100 family)